MWKDKLFGFLLALGIFLVFIPMYSGRGLNMLLPGILLIFFSINYFVGSEEE